MPKYIAYSLFENSTKEKFEQLAYVRGFYFNARMNNLIYPHWRTHVELDKLVYTKYEGLFHWLRDNNNLSFTVNDNVPQLCEGMLWRLKPIFILDITHVICRDTDSVTTYKEAQCVQEWLQTGFGFHAINDNPAHGGMMGGMVGFDCAKFKARMKWQTWQQVVANGNFSQHGADQDFFNNTVHPVIQDDLFLHNIAGAGCKAKAVTNNSDITLPGVNKRLWESNLVCRHIGSAGIVELEMLRFLKRFDEYNWKFKPIENEYPQLFYWV
jgi:hypothetical protein